MKKDIKRVSSLLNKHVISGKTTEIDNIHLTLKFLGDISDDKYGDVICGIEDVLDKIHPFNVGLGQIGFFDKKSNYRVLWLGITGDLDNLNEYFHILDSSLYKYGFDKEFRDYSPHITIGRNVKLDEELDSLNLVLPINYEHVCIVDKLYIYNSVSEDGRRLYKKIKEYDLV